MIRGVGVDLVERARMASAFGRHGERLVRRICTASEANGVLTSRHPDRELARVFALKEAVMKALGTGMRGVGWQEIETVGSTEGEVAALLRDRPLRLARLRGIERYALSVSVSADVVVATVILSGVDPR